MKEDGPADTKTRERTEGAATAVQAMHEDSFLSTGSSTLSFSRDDTLVDNGATAPKLCPSPLKMRSPTAAGGLHPAGIASTATRTTFNQPTLRFYSTEETNSKRASIQYALHYSCFWRNQLDAPSCRRVIETKSGQNLVFHPSVAGLQ